MSLQDETRVRVVSSLLALAERVEGLSGPCRTTDQDIGCSLGLFEIMPPKNAYVRGIIFAKIEEDGSRTIPGNGDGDALIPCFTASLDAAITLVPEGFEWMADNFDGPPGRRCSANVMRKEIDARGEAATPALALCAAALKARAQSGEQT